MCLRSYSQKSVSISDCVLQSIEDNYRRDSFDDRFCDDLSEVLLQFLPLNDKLRLECVSKQFQRTVFIKQCEITLYSTLQSNQELTKKSQQNEDNVFKTNDMKSIESVLKKCPNIQSMFLVLKNKRIFESIFRLITKYCRNLNEFNVSFKTRRTKPELNEEFLRLFGQKLKYISCGEKLDYNLFPNLYSIPKKSGLYPEYFPKSVLGLNPNLKEIKVILFDYNQHLFREVLQKFHKITHLSLLLWTANEKSVINSFRESPVLQNLIELNYQAHDLPISEFLVSTKQLSEKLAKLKSIEINSVYVKNFSDLRQQLFSLKEFSELKRLKLELKFLKTCKKSKFSFKAFEELQNITHLRLVFNARQLNEEILTDIDIYLPKLQYLFIINQIITDEEGVTQMAETLSRLSCLQTILLNLKYRRIAEQMTEQIAEKCRKIRKIKV